jgi:hypothetical protein
VTSLVQSRMAEDVAAEFCTTHIRTDQGELMVDGDIHTASWNGCCDMTVARVGCGLRNAGGEVAGTCGMGLGGCWG